ncbi:hypothetical protein F2Q69_00014280 [Brassica cretica]|uniref:Uncharacterized protein n=1 Tax=Brassica cretica TaxID=69181 RepID=A0A8S9QPZ7_BRACR|nr:hypothetical protein F2Q69_00014280 [Brassica cretica]
MDKPHLDPNTKLLTKEYAEGVGEFMRLVHQQPEANTEHLRVLHPYEPGTMPVELLVLQPGQEHLRVLHPYPQGYTTWFNKSKNDISRCINQMMYSMLRKGYPTYSVIPNEECHLWFRNFVKELWLNGKTPKYINPTVWLELQEHWVDQETIDKSIKNSANRNNYRGGKGIYVHNLGACSMSSKEDELRRTLTRRRGKFRISSSKIIDFVQTQKEALLASQPISDDDSSAASTNITRVRIHQIVEQLQNKDDRMVALETQNATILAELVGQKKTNEEIMEKMKRLFPNDF